MAPEVPVIRASKRKRNPVSYLADDYFESIDFAVSEQDTEKDAAIISNRDASMESFDSDDLDGSFGGHSNGKAPKKKKKVKATPKAKKVKPVIPFRFLDLPAELRDEIYDLALTDPSGITLISSKARGPRHTVRRGKVAIQDGQYYSGKLQRPYQRWYHRAAGNATATTTHIGARHADLSPNLCAVSKQLREEASSVMYKQSFVLEDTTALHVFVASIGSFNRQLLAQITVKGWGLNSAKSQNFAAFAAMMECVNLQSLFLDCSIGESHESPQKIAQKLYTDAHLFFEAFGSANGGRDAAVVILEMGAFHFKDENADGPGTTFSEKKHENFEVALRSHLKR